MNFSNLLKPIEQNLPAGQDLRQIEYSQSLYYKIKDARNSARNIERQQIQGSNQNSSPDWSIVYHSALEALEKQSKDVEIITWLIEASLREFGFAGLRDSFKLAGDIVDNFWDHLHPLPDEEGMMSRLAPLNGLNGEDSDGVLIAPIALVPIIQHTDGSHYALWHYQQAIEVMRLADPDKRNKRISAGTASFESIEQAAQEMDIIQLKQQYNDVLECITAFKDLNEKLEAKVGIEAPPSSKILAQLEACVDCIKTLTNGRLFENPKPAEFGQSVVDNIGGEDSSEVEVKQGKTISNLNSREQVIKSVKEAADFFRNIEPHSPIPYLLDRAVKWSKMPLPSLLKELIKNEAALDDFCNLTGIDVQNKQN